MLIRGDYPAAMKRQSRMERSEHRLLAPLLASLLLLQPGVAAPQAPPPQGAAAPAHASPQAPARPAPQTKSDEAQAAFVVESLATHARFESDGTGRLETTARIRVQSDDGARALSELVFPYNSVTERFEIPYVRVGRADGSAPQSRREPAPGDVQDLAAQAARDAPLYNDAREKHVTVPAMHPGDVLEYQIVEMIFHPMAPGQFWYQFEFEKSAITLSQTLELNVPAGRALKLEARPGYEGKMEETGDRRIYRWSSSHTAQEEENAQKIKSREEQTPGPDVRASTFASWEELGAWYGQLQRAALAVTPEIQKKADEVTQGRAAPIEKLEALYDYVAKNFRSVGLGLGAAGYEPHPPALVLKNGYGDSKDKHTLLAALAAAEGLSADAVLVHSQRKLDREMPSPASFDHVMTRATAGGEVVWLDTSTEVAPFRFLASSVRHKQALDIPADGPATLVETPADPPSAVHQLWRIEGKVSELGKLDARVHYVLGGDNDLLLRLAFRHTAQAKWKELGQTIAASDGLRGMVDEVTPGDPADTRHPFTLDYHFVEPGFLDWTSRRVELALPLPPLALPEPTPGAAGAGQPIELGSPAEVTLEMKLAVPARYRANAPAAINVARDFGEYHSSYSATAGALTATRTLNIRQREIPAEHAADYSLFFRPAVRNDEVRAFLLETAVAGAAAIPEHASADELVEAATRAYSSQMFALAEQMFERAVTLNPMHKTAWKLLGAVRLAQQENAKAAEAFRKDIELDPHDEFAYEGLGLAQAALQQYDDAIVSFRKQLEIKPLDPMAQASLGATLADAHRYPEAVAELQKAIALAPDDARLYVNLGRAELNLGHIEKAQAAFDKTLEFAPSPAMWNAIAYELSLHSVNLERAQQYEESAIAATAGDLRNVTLERVTPRDLARVALLARSWDTLGWVCFERGDRKRGERFVEASWLLSPRGESGDHLGQIYEKQGRTEEAMRAYALALAAPNPMPETRARLEKLAGGAAEADARTERARAEIPGLLEYKPGRLLPATASGAAEFLVLIGPGSKAEAVKFIGGEEALRGAGEKLRALDYGRMFPDESPTKLIRRGTLACAVGEKSCTFRLAPAEQALR
jgi:tetratricopeptide (TPR) repeat protein